MWCNIKTQKIMARRKSINDIREQRYRLNQEAYRRGDYGRAARVYNIGARYINNISETPTQRRLTERINSTSNDNEAMSLIERADNIRYSRSTYMGLNEG